LAPDWTYKIPNEDMYLKALLILLKRKGLEDISNLLKDSTCKIIQSSNFSRVRWNAYATTVYFYLPLDKWDLRHNDIMFHKDEIISICNELMPKEAGLDVLNIEISPSLEDIKIQESLLDSLSKVDDILSSDIKAQILPEDIIEKGKQMSEAYIYLYVVENTIRLFIDSVAKNYYGNVYFNKLKLNREIKSNLGIRKEDERKNQWLRVRGDSDIFYLDFDDLGSIIRNNWQIFQDFFPSQEWIVTKIDELSKCRNLVAHNSIIDKDERDLVRVNFTQILKQIGTTLNKNKK